MLLNFSTSSDTGYVYETKFVFKKTNLPSFSITSWDLGDGTLVYEPTLSADNSIGVEHIYKYPGVYRIGLSAWTQSGDFETTEKYIDVDYKVKDRILFTDKPTQWNTPGQPTHKPFVVSLTSTKIDEPLSLVLHAANSDSVPYFEIDDKWRFIVPTWKFIDSETLKPLRSPVLLETVPLYGETGIIAVSASCKFYYIDYSSTLNKDRVCPVLITATLSTEQFTYPPESLVYPYFSYSNNEVVKAVETCHVLDAVPTELKVTENFIQDTYPVKWSNIPIPVMVTCRFDPAHSPLFADIEGISAADIFTYPKSNDLGLLYNVTLSISGLSSNQCESDKNLYFKSTDKNGSIASGYIFSTITPLTSINSAKIIASTTIVNELTSTKRFAFPTGYPLNTTAFISHPFANNINKVDVNSYLSKCSEIVYYKNLGLLPEGRVESFSVPTVESENTNNLQLSGVGGILGLTLNPVKNILYAADADSNKIHLFKNNALLSSVDLSSVLSKPVSPSYISIDKNHNVWISTYDSSKILKYNYLMDTLMASASFESSLSGNFEEFDSFNLPFMSPPIVETDLNNDVWVCYSHPLSSYIAKFDSYGNQLFVEKLDYNAVPVSLNIDQQNNLWVACREGNSIFCYDTNGTKLSSFDFLKPSFTTLDRSSNLWIAHGYNLVSVLNTQTLGVSSWRLQTTPIFKYELIRSNYIPYNEYSEEEIANSQSNNEMWGGLASDVLNRIWFINSESNFAGTFFAEEPSNMKFATLVPTVCSQPFIGDYLEDIPTNAVRSAQAIGDWTGNKWYQKYAKSTNYIQVSGTSNSFSILNLTGHSNYKNYTDTDFSKLAKVNEDFNYSDYLQKLALPELINQNKSLFDSFFPGLVGNDEVTSVENPGKLFYEKIANFNANHSDVDTAEIKQLKSLAKQVYVESKDFGIDFPSEVSRLLNIFSVPLHDLRGTVTLEEDPENRIGALLMAYDTVSANQYIYAKDRIYNTIQLIYLTPENSETTVFPLTSLDIDGLRGNINEIGNTNFDNYYFFALNDVALSEYQNNVIDWNSPDTTLSYTLSTEEDYYSDNGIVELYFNNLLTRKIFE